MFIAATNTVTIYALPGHANVVSPLLFEIAETLRDIAGCISYTAVQSHYDPDLWIVTGHWKTQSQMTEHFNSSAHDKYAELLNSKAIRSLEFNCQSFD